MLHVFRKNTCTRRWMVTPLFLVIHVSNVISSMLVLSASCGSNHWQYNLYLLPLCFTLRRHSKVLLSHNQRNVVCVLVNCIMFKIHLGEPVLNIQPSYFDPEFAWTICCSSLSTFNQSNNFYMWSYSSCLRNSYIMQIFWTWICMNYLLLIFINI